MLKIAWSSHYAHPLPAGHRFPMEKYILLPEQLEYEGTIQAANLFEPEMLSEEVLLRTHEEEYWQRLKSLALSPAEIRKTGFPLSESLVTRESIIMNGTVQAAFFALENGVAMNIAGGTHHAFANRGEGFCLLNDQAIAANELLHQGLAKRIMIVDLDVHQGNGTASLFEQKEQVFTFSMHGGNNYPLHKETSDCDVPLPDGIEDTAYLKLLDHHFHSCLDAFEPNFLFYQCGVDVLRQDKLGRLGLTELGCKKRDAVVLKAAYQAKIPLVASMGGGYSERIADIVNAHANTFRLAQEIWF